MGTKPLKIYETKTVAGLAYPSEISSLFDLEKEFSFKVLEEALRLELKKNGLVPIESSLEVETSLERYTLIFKTVSYNTNFLEKQKAKLGPRPKEVEKLNDLITAVLANYGIAANIESKIYRIFKSEKREYLTGGVIGNDRITEHFHLVVPNLSGRGSTSLFDACGSNEHYHIVDGVYVGPAERNGQRLEEFHTHSIHRFLTGLYDSTEAKPGVDELQIFSHTHIDAYLNQVGDGFLEAFNVGNGIQSPYTHKHEVKGGIVFPADGVEGKHTHRIKVTGTL